ncbi:putative 3-phenylpropionic acid transporter [mine drainage metagenome]|uniref:Putative 3-phenylpropionic acid transporter n=1 Tax=mine drainage metagenome TaxID=410659 RepID=A0A1J5RRL4_9ZZZZ
MSRGGLSLRLSLFYAALFGVIGVQMPFWPLYLSAKGLDPARIGQLLAAAYFIKIILNPVAGHVVDRHGARRTALLVFSGIAVLASLLFAPARGFSALLLVTLLAAASFSALVPLSDNLTMQSALRHDLDYGRIRLWGSLAFIATSMLGGRWLLDAPRWSILAAIVAGQALTFLAVWPLPADRQARTEAPPRLPLRPLLRSRGFPLFLAATSLIQVSHMIYYGFATLHWRAAGLPGTVIGALWAEGVVAEVLLFAFGRRLVSRFGPPLLIAAGGLAGALRWTVLGLTTDPLALAAVQFLHAFTFGATHLGAMHYIARTAPPALSARAQGLYASVANGMVPGLAMLAAGPLYQDWGGRAFLAMSLLAAGGLGLALRLWRQSPGGGHPVKV